MYIFGGAIFTLWVEPLNLATRKQWCATTTAEPDQNSCAGQHAHRRLCDGCTRAEHDDGGIGNRNVPVVVFVLGFGQIQNPSVFLHHAALALPSDKQDAILKDYGIPTDSTDNQFKVWIKAARATNEELRIAIKADSSTPYKVIKDVMTSLQDLRENRYNLITSLKVESAK